MTLVAGSYERFLFGYRIQESQSTISLERAFVLPAHQGAVKSLVSCGQYVAAGGHDDVIHIYDLKNDRDLGFLTNPGQGAITSLQFFAPLDVYAPTHLFSGSADGTLCIWQVGTWECLKVMRGHRKDITGISIHPSGSLALTTSSDGTFRVWDLKKGRTTFKTKIGGGLSAEGVHLSPSGNAYALLLGKIITVHTLLPPQKSAPKQLKHDREVLAAVWGHSDDILISAGSDGSISVWDVNRETVLLCVAKAHSLRIKALALLPSSFSSSIPERIATASSDGSIKIWDLRSAVENQDRKTEPIYEVETKARLLHLCVVEEMERAEKTLPTQTSRAGKAMVKKKKPTPKKRTSVEEGIVSFIEEEDVARMKKSKKKVLMNAQRAAITRERRSRKK